jgi:hypothetical protein
VSLRRVAVVRHEWLLNLRSKGLHHVKHVLEVRVLLKLRVELHASEGVGERNESRGLLLLGIFLL